MLYIEKLNITPLGLLFTALDAHKLIPLLAFYRSFKNAR